MRLVLLAALLLAPAASVAAPELSGAAPLGNSSAAMPLLDPNAGAVASCPPTSRYDAARRGERPGAQMLSELPAGDHYKAVYRKIGSCEVPVIAGYGIGSTQR